MLKKIINYFKQRQEQKLRKNLVLRFGDPVSADDALRYIRFGTVTEKSQQGIGF